MERSSARTAVDHGASSCAGAAARHPLCYAHRGARAYLPENTLPAFELAFNLGADGIECDVQRSRDGQLVILHDGTVNRTTDGGGLVSAYSLAALRALDAGRSRRIPAQVPTLEETLALVRANGKRLNLEIKGETAAEAVGTAEAVETVLSALDAEQRSHILVSSFELSAVKRLKQRLPWLRVAALYSGRQWRREDMIAPALALGAEAIHPGLSLVTPALIHRAHAAGLGVNVWTANMARTIRTLLRWGVDGIFCDYPERVVIVRARLTALGVLSVPDNADERLGPISEQDSDG